MDNRRLCCRSRVFVAISADGRRRASARALVMPTPLAPYSSFVVIDTPVLVVVVAAAAPFWMTKTINRPVAVSRWSSTEVTVNSSRLRVLRLRRMSTTSWAESSRPSGSACTITDVNFVKGMPIRYVWVYFYLMREKRFHFHPVSVTVIPISIGM